MNVESPAPPARPFLREHRTLLLWTAISFFVCAALPFFNHSRYGDLSDWFNDHLHHPFATWVALQRGTEIYTRPFQEIWDGSGYPLEFKSWGEMPMAYPPGVFAVFLPTALIGRYVPMSLHAAGVLNMTYVVLLAHLAFFAVLLLLKELPSGSRALVGAFSWLLIASLAMNGFYDPIFVGAAAMMLRALARKRPGDALIWLGVGALMHFRMASFAPFGLAALVQIYQQRKSEKLPWKSLAFVAVAAVICVWTFVLMYPATATFRSTHPPVLQGLPKTMVIIYSLLLTAACLYLADVFVALSVLACLVLAIVEQQPFSWHAAILLAPLLAVGVWKLPRQASISRTLIFVWALAIGPLVWRDSLVTLLSAFAQYAKL